MKKAKISKKLLLTALLIPSAAFVFGLSGNDSVDKKITQLQNDTLDVGTSRQSTINSFSDYDILASSKDSAPVVTKSGMLGISKDKKSLTLTTYDGILVWENKFAENKKIIKYYQDKKITNLDSYIVNNFIYVPETNILAILFGESNHTNQTFFALNFDTGTLFEPIPNKSSIVDVQDEISYLYLNSALNIIGTTGGQQSKFSSKTMLFTVNSNQGISAIDLNTTKTIGKESSDHLIYIVKGFRNINFAVFISDAKIDTTSNARKVYLVVVDDYLVPKTNNDQKITYDIGEYENITDPSNNPDSINWDDVTRYQTKSLWQDNSWGQNFTVIVPGKKSKILSITCSWTYSFWTNYTYDFDSYKDSIYTFIYAGYENKNYIYVSNKRSENGNAIVRLEVRDNGFESSIIERNTDAQYYDSSTHIYNQPILIAPVVTSERLSNPDPFLVIRKNQELEAKYFVTDTEIFKTTIQFKKYNNIVDNIKKDSSYQNNLPSSVPERILKEALTFTSSLVDYQIRIEDRHNDDNNGVLKFNLKPSYTNWYDENTRTEFTIPIEIDGYYALNEKFKFNFVKELTGDKENDDKYKQVSSIISSTYANDVTKEQILNNFIIYSVTGKDNSEIKLSESNISLSVLNSGASLKVQVNFPGGNLPYGTQLSYSRTYDGFKTIAGYEFSVKDESNQEIIDFKKGKYASDISKADFINNFIDLGVKWSKNIEDWDYSGSFNNYDGTLYVTLKYKHPDQLPKGVSATVLSSRPFTGFKKIQEQFITEDNKVSISDYIGEANPSSLWNAYLTNKEGSELFQTIKFPYVANNNDLEIEALNEDTMDQDGYIDLAVQMKLNTQTTLPVSNVSGNPFFIFNQDAKQRFEEYFKDEYPFKLRWNITQISQDFTWQLPQDSNIHVTSQNVAIDLSKTSIDGINKNMYADEVKVESIQEMFKTEYYNSEVVLIPNVSKGTLEAIITLIPKVQSKSSMFSSQLSDNTVSGNLVKTITFTNFRVPIPIQKDYLTLIVASVLAFTLTCILIACSVYTIRKGKYKKMYKKTNIK